MTHNAQSVEDQRITTAGRRFMAAATSRSSTRWLATVLVAAALLIGLSTTTPGASASSPQGFENFNASATGRDWVNAYLLSLLSYYAYDEEIPGAMGNNCTSPPAGKVCFEEAFEAFFAPLGLSNFTYINVEIAPLVDTQAMVAETDDAVIIAFRGTQQPVDFATDLAALPITLDGIHFGFATATYWAMPEVTAAIGAAGDKKVWLTGHSLGGAIAQVAAYELAIADVPVQGIVTFGSPRVFTIGSSAAHEYYTTYGETRSQRWVNHLDPIPHALLAPAFLHVGQWTVITVDAEDQSCAVESMEFYPVLLPDLADHDIDRTSTRIFSLMPASLRSGLPLPPLPDPVKAQCDLLPNLPPTAPVDSDASANAIIEGASAGTPVGITASSTDPNGDTITYSLSNNAGGRFAINSTSGVVTVANATLLNFEDSNSHTITVVASDGVFTANTSFTIAVLNVPPTTPVDVDGAANEVYEGAATGTAVGITAFSTDPNGPPVTYRLAADAGGRFSIDAATGVVRVADGMLLDGPATYTVSIVASDGFADSAPASFGIQIHNVPPAILSVDLSATSIDEGQSVTVTGTFTDPAMGIPTETFSGTAIWSDGVSTVLNVGEGTFSTSRLFLDDDPSGTPFALFTVDITIEDDDGGSDTATSTVLTVHNVPPVPSVDSLDGGLAFVGLVGVPVSFEGSFTDVGVLDTHTARVDWGDGSTVEDFGGNEVISPVSASHVYMAPGVYDVSFIVVDDDTGESTVVATITIYDSAEATSTVVDLLTDQIAQENDPGVLAALQSALDALVGDSGGLASNGALRQFELGNHVAALVQIEKAIAHLKEAEAAGGTDTSDLRRLLALAAWSTAQDAYNRAVLTAGPNPSSGEQQRLGAISTFLEGGVAAMDEEDYSLAVFSFRNAVQRAGR